jgi:hypothetical protein
MTTDKLITALGEAVVASWGKLPAEVQQAIFEAAIHALDRVHQQARLL